MTFDLSVNSHIGKVDYLNPFYLFDTRQTAQYYTVAHLDSRQSGSPSVITHTLFFNNHEVGKMKKKH